MRTIYLDKEKAKFYKRSDFVEGPLLNVEGLIIKVSSLDTLVPWFLRPLTRQYINFVLHPVDDTTAIIMRTPKIMLRWAKK